MEKLNRKRSKPSRASQSRSAAAHASPGARDLARPTRIPKHSLRLLLGVARQSGIGDPDSCMTILSILSASHAIRYAMGRELDRELGFQDNSGSRFATLITLYALEPLPATAADLAYHAEVSRGSMTDVLGTLEKRGLITRDAGGRDRIKFVYLTERGRKAAVFAVHRFLQLASNLVGDLSSPYGNATVETCQQVESRAAVPAQ